jgi:hypothetical protein
MPPERRQHWFQRRAALALTLLTLLAPTGLAFAQGANDKPRPSRQEEARRKLLEQMGLKKGEKGPAPAEPPPDPPKAAPDPDVAAPGPAPADGPVSLAPRPAAASTFSSVHDPVLKSCRSCHSAAGMAAASRFVLSGQIAADHAASRAFVDLGNPARSLLLTKATATVPHGGGATIAAGGEIYRRLFKWIASGAHLEARADGTAGAGAVTKAQPQPRAEAVSPGTPSASVPSAVVTSEAQAPVPAPSPPVSSPPEGAPGERAAGLPNPGDAAAVAFQRELVRACLSCHQKGGPAGLTRFVLDGGLQTDLTASARFVDGTHSMQSPLAAKARGEAHGGGPVWPPDSEGHRALVAWLGVVPAMGQAPTGSPAAAVPAPVVAAAPAARPTDATSGATPRLALLGREFTLNGRFDVNLERRGFDANPLGGGTTALQSHHHFVFLGRQSVDDPFTFTAELTSLLFYEAGVRLGPGRRPFGVHLRAGKLLVPFGNEPLFHQSYGGHVGFDQKVLPAVWASEGLAASGHLDLGPITMTADLYGVRGHGLRRADAVLNLQTDQSPVEDSHPAGGLRLGGSKGPLTGFYSAYFNPLGHERRLFMQALDLSLWRWRRFPVLDRLVLGAGFLRADVSGGGAGRDHYHFASYWLARIYTCEWLSLQYRQGLRTFDNKRGLVFDGRRRTVEDGSTHNVAVVARVRGLAVSLSYFLNFEKADEVDDDLARLAVAYEF